MPNKKCMAVECTKVSKMKGYCLSHAKELLDPETWASCKLKHCKVSGCTAKIVFRNFCEEHGRQELGDERFDILWNTIHNNNEHVLKLTLILQLSQYSS